MGAYVMDDYRRALLGDHDCFTDKCQEAHRMALSSLRPISREQVERMRGEWRLTEYPFMGECEDCSVCGYRTAWGHGFRFCPRCGAPMTDEAVQMVMERLEALYETAE